MAAVAGRGGLEELEGIGKDLAGKIKEYLDTGGLKFYDDLKKEFPEGVIDLLSIPGVGPATAKIVYEKSKVKDIDDLEALARAGKLQGLPGIQKKTEENILKGIALLKAGRERLLLGRALPLSEEIIASLRKLPEVKEIVACGSLRRMKETVRDLDILVVSTRPQKVMDVFVGLPVVKQVNAHGATKSSVVTGEGIQADLRVVEPESFGAALVYFTGSKTHNIRIRELAKRKGLKINEYGVYDLKTEKRIAGKTEEDIYRSLGMQYIPPEMREDAGEVEAAQEKKIPRLVELADIRGDLHVHTRASDGADTIMELVEYARKLGYRYLAITEHSRSLKIAGGLSDKELAAQVEEIRKLNKKLKGFTVLAGTEVDIDNEGKLDFPDALLAELDIVVASIHTGFKQSKEKLTARIVRACENRRVNVISHPTGRLMGEREPYDLDFDKVLAACRRTNTALEINSYPQRLDLTDVNCRRAKETGVKMVINTDAHVLAQMEAMRLGVSVARRGWLEKADVLNTLEVEELKGAIKKG